MNYDSVGGLVQGVWYDQIILIVQVIFQVERSLIRRRTAYTCPALAETSSPDATEGESSSLAIYVV